MGELSSFVLGFGLTSLVCKGLHEGRDLNLDDDLELERRGLDLGERLLLLLLEKV